MSPVRSLAGLGRPSLLVALVFSLLAIGAFIAAGRTGRRDLSEAGKRALYATFGFTALATISLVSALLAHDFSLNYVANYTSRSLSVPYTISALWGGMEGSLLFWTTLLTGFSALAIAKAPARRSRLIGGAGAVLMAIAGFFLFMVAFPGNPFAQVTGDVPIDGNGLNPLLQSPGMIIHPPLLYTGFVGFSIPFAFAIGALFTNRVDDSWFVATRQWTLFAWTALSVGIVLGGAWAYTELGWGGYWAWDPVENASFMPWLTATAFLHSVVIQEKRRMLKVWNVTLIVLTYAFAVFGTFLTRSGLLSSIHTFSEGPIGKYFLPFLALLLIGGLGMVAYRLDALRSENRLDALISRESAFIANNVLFVAAAFTVLWGTIYPIVAEVSSGIRLSVGPPFYNAIFTPIGLAIIGLTGIGPLISWRRMSKGAFWRMVRVPLAAGGTTVVVLGVGGLSSPGALLSFALVVFTATAIIGEFVRGSRVYRRRDDLGAFTALNRTIARNRRRYGGYIVHLGVLLIVIGFAGNAFKVERRADMAPGDTLDIAAYTLTYEGVRTATTPEKEILEARLSVSRGGDDLGPMRPQRNLHLAQGQWQSEVAIRTNPIEDLYVVVTGFDTDGSAVIRTFVNPLTWWIWAGAAVMLSGMLVIMSGRAPVTVTSVKRAPAKRAPAVAR
ncbi:MAG: heme lyase CcmF/NrfE family subunit [Actinobacteria bacterium]|nr:heme lyase CcmF/NrfE family subunit [Actinomycetota bacterium]